MDDLLDQLNADVLSAYQAERDGDLTEALRLWRLISGPIAMIRETEHEGMRITRGDVEKKIADLEKVINKSVGFGGMQRIPVEFKRPLVANDLDYT